MKRLLSIVVVFVLFLTPAILQACSKGCVGGECGTCTGKKAYDEDFEKDPKAVATATITTLSLSAMIKSKVPMALFDCRSGRSRFASCRRRLLVKTASPSAS